MKRKSLAVALALTVSTALSTVALSSPGNASRGGHVFVSAKREVAFRTAGLAPGTYKFQCCIHPWMRVVLTVS